jgi:hypothetical protein
VVQDNASVSFGATPLLLQLATGHYKNISIHTAGNARGMKADVLIEDVRLDGHVDAMGTVGALDAVITWSADGIRQSIQDAIPPLRGLVTGSRPTRTTAPSRCRATWAASPPSRRLQKDEWRCRWSMSPQITDDVVTAHYSTRDTSIPQGNEGNQRNKDNQDPCFAGL